MPDYRKPQLSINDVKPEIEKVLNALNSNRCLLFVPKSSGRYNTSITAQNLYDIIGNHEIKDDWYWENPEEPNEYGVTQFETHRLRAYFQDPNSNYYFVQELHETFPDVMEPETEDFLEHINKFREERNLEPIKLDD